MELLTLIRNVYHMRGLLAPDEPNNEACAVLWGKRQLKILVLEWPKSRHWGYYASSTFCHDRGHTSLSVRDSCFPIIPRIIRAGTELPQRSRERRNGLPAF